MKKISFKSIKSFTIGLIIGASLLSTGNAFANALTLEKIQAYINYDISIKYNSKDVSLSNPPITYNGKTYLPLTDVGKITNTNVKWNQKERSVEMTSNQSLSNVQILDDYFPNEVGNNYAIKINDTIYVQIGAGSRTYGIFKETMYDKETGVYFTNNDKIINVSSEPSDEYDAFLYRGNVFIKESILKSLEKAPE